MGSVFEVERSAGIVLYRHRTAGHQVLLGHMGGPFWAKQDAGAWSIPKGLVDSTDRDDWATARREFFEETGHEVSPADEADAVDLGVFRQHRGKQIHIWAVPGELDVASCTSSTFTLEWPPRSGRYQEFPEIDRMGWFDHETALDKIVKGQRPVLDALAALQR